MRKYTQLGLIIVALVSAIGLLFLERQYAHMKVFLEVADIFEASDVNIKCNKKLRSLRSSLESKLQQSSQGIDASWRQIASDVYVYSSLYNGTSAIATTLLIGDKSLIKLCRLNFEDDYSTDVVPTFATLASSPPYEAFALYCHNTNRSLVPISIELLNVDIPVEELVSSNVPSTAVCIRPLSYETSDVQLAEFLTLHSDIGIDNFFIYDQSLAKTARKFVRSASFIQTELDVNLRQWNVPVFGEKILHDTVLAADCFLRSAANSRFVALLSIKEFFVIRLNGKISSFLDTVLRNQDILSVHQRFFCQEYPDDVVASVLNYPFVTLRKTKFSKEKNLLHRAIFTHSGSLGRLEDFVKLSKSHHDEFKSAMVSEESAHLNLYEKCDDGSHVFQRGKNLKNVFDDTFLTAKHGNLFASKLYRNTINYNSGHLVLPSNSSTFR